MSGNRRFGVMLCAVTFLLAVLHPALTFPQDMLTSLKGDMKQCYEYEVGANIPIKYVTLEKSLTFMLNSSDSLLHLRLMVEDTLLKATVSGTYVVLKECDHTEINCTVIDEGGSKTSDIISTTSPNYITVSYDNNEVKVDVNNRADAVGMPMIKHVEDDTKSEVAIVNVDPFSDITHNTDYSGYVRVLCNNDGSAPEIREMSPLPMPTPRTPIFTTSLFPSRPTQPFKECKVAPVEADHPYNFMMMSESSTMAVLPSSPSLQLHMTVSDEVYKFIAKEGKMDLLKCNTDMDAECESLDSNDLNTNVLGDDQWTFVTITVSESEVRVDLNNLIHVSSESGISESSLPFVTVLPTQPTGKAQHYSVMVNRQCKDDFQRQYTVTMEPITVSEASISTTSANNATTSEHSTGTDPRTIGIIVGILLTVILIAATAFAISSLKKRRTATINHHTPLDEQQHKK